MKKLFKLSLLNPYKHVNGMIGDFYKMFVASGVKQILSNNTDIRKSPHRVNK